jgi:helix-turn-helix protein
VTRSYKYRVYPTAAQAAALDRQLGEACDLYNAAPQASVQEAEGLIDFIEGAIPNRFAPLQDGGERDRPKPMHDRCRATFKCRYSNAEYVRPCDLCPYSDEARRSAEQEVERLRAGMRKQGFVLGRNPDGVDDTVAGTLLVVRDAMADVERLREALRVNLADAESGAIDAHKACRLIADRSRAALFSPPAKPYVTSEQLHKAARAIQEYPPGDLNREGPIIPRSIRLAENAFIAAGFEIEEPDEPKRSRYPTPQTQAMRDAVEAAQPPDEGERT